MWESVRIGDFGTVITGKTPPSANPEFFGDEYPFITPTDMDEGRAVETERGISQEGYARFRRQIVPPRSVCFVCIGATIGKICLTTEKSLTNQQINSVVVNTDRHDPHFVYYLLSTYRQAVKGIAGGAATPIVNKSTFENIEAVAPSLPVQRRIGAILSAYDDLIENNLRRIKILEEMAQNLYREWFVKFRFPGYQHTRFVDSILGPIPEGWEVKTMGEVALNFDRLRKPLSSIQRAQRKGVYPYYGAAKIFDYIDAYIFDGVYLLLAEDGSVVTTDRKPVLQYVSGKFWPNNHTHILQGKGSVSTEFLYMVLSETDITGYITGAAQPKITQANLNRIPVLVAENSVLHAFNEFLTSIFRQKIIFGEKNEVLRRTRDLLLPKLITGELDVSDVEIAVPEEQAA